MCNFRGRYTFVLVRATQLGLTSASPRPDVSTVIRLGCSAGTPPFVMFGHAFPARPRGDPIVAFRPTPRYTRVSRAVVFPWLLMVATYRRLSMSRGSLLMHVLHLATTGYRALSVPLEVDLLPAVLLLPLGVPTGLGIPPWRRLRPLATPLMTLGSATEGPTLVVELAHLRRLSVLIILEVMQLPTVTTLLTWAREVELPRPR